MLQAELMLSWLSSAEDECVHFATGAEFRLGMRKQVFALAILDWVLPDDDGLEVLAWLRRSVSANLPVMMVTARDEEQAIVQALDAGADDYLTKPVSRAELLARVRAVVRRGEPAPSGAIISCGGVTLDRGERTASVRGETVTLTDKEFELAACLLEKPGRLFTRELLQKQVWGRETDTVTRSLDTHLSRLRAKLGLTPEYGFELANVYGKGYRLEIKG